MNGVATIKGRKYIRLDSITFARVEPEYEFLLDEQFVEKVKKAYNVQVVLNNGWGFTVQHMGCRVRFDLQNNTGYKLPRIYEGYVEQESGTVQTKF